MFAALWTLNLAVLVGLAVMAWSPKYGAFRGSAVNPLIMFIVFSVFFNINFLVLRDRGSIQIFERAFPVTSVDILTGYLYYTILFICAAVGMVLAQLTFQPEECSAERSQAGHGGHLRSRVLFIAIISIGLLGAYMTAQNLAALLSGKITRQVLFTSNPLLTVAYSVVCPGLAIFLAHRHPTRLTSLLAILASMLVLSTTGSRGVIILLGVIFLINWTLHGRRIGAQWYLVLVPTMVFLLAFSRYILRESFRFRSFGDFVSYRGGLGQLFFNSSEVAMADAITVIAANTDLFARPPFENFLGVAMYPLPRSIFTFKPLGAAGYFTGIVSPLRWQVTKSEILTTAYGELVMYYGLWIGALLALVLAFFWLRACLRVMNASHQRTAIWLPFLIWWMYLFVRGTLFNVGGSIWPFAVVMIGFTLLSRLRFGTSGGASTVRG